MTVSKAKICGFSRCFTEDLSLEVDGTRLASRWPWEDTFGAWHARKIWGRRTAGMWFLFEKYVFHWTCFFFLLGIFNGWKLNSLFHFPDLESCADWILRYGRLNVHSSILSSRPKRGAPTST
jgi:hypothetical protein